MKKKTLVGAFSWLEGLFQLYKMLRLTLGDMTRLPCCSVYRLDITISRSLVCFTGRNLQCKIITFLIRTKFTNISESSTTDLALGTLTPDALSKHFMAAPTAVSS